MSGSTELPDVDLHGVCGTQQVRKSQLFPSWVIYIIVKKYALTKTKLPENTLVLSEMSNRASKYTEGDRFMLKLYTFPVVVMFILIMKCLR